MQRFALIAALAATVGLAVAGVGAAGTYRGVPPVYTAGNPTCSDLPGLASTTPIKFSSPVNGASAGGISIVVDGNRVAWFTFPPIHVQAVIVKGGPNANVYFNGGHDFSDGTLDTVTNPKNGKSYGLGDVTFCTTVGSV